MKKWVLALGIFFTIATALADVRVNSYVEQRKIGLQDMLKFTIEISDESTKHIEQPSLPNIDNFTLVSTSSSHSSSMQIVNGRMTSSITVSYTYQLKPHSVGNFLIPPIRLHIKGRNFVTEAIAVEVVKGTTERLPPSASGFSQDRQQSSEAVEDNLFIIANVSKTDVFRGEPLTVEFAIYTRYTISNLSFLKEPEFSGFWKETIKRADRVQFQRTRYQGQMFNMMPLISVALFPTTTGSVTIPSLEMSVDVRLEARSFFDFGSTRKLTVASNPVVINVKDVPRENRPENFSGAIGQFSLKSSISDTELKVGDSFTYTLEISGNGNIAQFEQPVLPSINHLRFLSPEVSTVVSDNKIAGVKSFKYLVIAQEKGRFTMPAIPFAYFDTQTGTYKTIYTDSYQIEVEESPTGFLPASASQTPVQAEAFDIRFIITDIPLKNTLIYFSSFWYWFLWFLLLLTILPAAHIAKEREKLAENLDYTRQKQANKILKKYLKEASANAHNGKMEFYANAQNGLSSYLADKCKIARGATLESIISQLKQKKLEESFVQEIKNFFDSCNQARFMPGGFSKEKINEDYKTLQKLVNVLSKRRIK